MSTPTETMVEEKKDDEDVVNVVTPTTKPPPPALSPSKRRAKAASSAGLSELSKQLRILQAKNESQSVDINRLERQLRILAELQGISVADLRKALEDACANEAFGELQHRVAKLRAELEAASLAKRAEYAKDAAAPHIANLELRVGELEEVEEKHQREIHHLYEQLKHEKERATRLEMERDQHKKDAEEYLKKLNEERLKYSKLEASFQEQMQKHMEEQAKKLQELAKQAAKAKQAAEEAEKARAKANAAAASANATESSSSVGASGGGSRAADRGVGADSLSTIGKDADSGSNNTNSQSLASIQMAADYERMVQLLKQKDEEIRNLKAQLQAEQEKFQKLLKEQQDQINQQQIGQKVDQDKMALTIRQLEDNDSQNELRLAQYKARFAVQDERIADMGQQLNSLYVAFQMLKEEMDAEDMKQAALKCNLHEADAEIAKQLHNMEKQKSQRGGLNAHSSSQTSSPRGGRGSNNNYDDGFASGFVGRSQRSSARGGADGYARAARSSSRRMDEYSTTSGVSAIERDLLNQYESSYKNSPSHVPRVIDTTPTTIDSYSTTGYGNDGYPSARAIGTPVHQGSTSPSSQRDMYLTPYTTKEDFPPPPDNTPTTWQLLFPEENRRLTTTTNPSEGVLISGLLIVKSKNAVVRKWKTKQSKLHLQGDHYQLKLGDTKSYALEFGISKVEFYPNHPLSFMVHVNPYDSTAPIIYAAGTCEKDYNAWMQALTKATTGGDYAEHPANPPIAPRRSLSAAAVPSSPASSSPSVARRATATSESLVVSVSNHGGDEDAELKQALELSKYCV